MMLVLVGTLLGAFSMWAFRRMANFDQVRRTVNRIQAHVLEFWLFQDEPAMMWKSWKGLLTANVRFLGLLSIPLLVLGAVMTPVYFFLEALYGVAPLPLGQPALVTLSINSMEVTPSIELPEGLTIDAPPVRIPSEHQVTWRIRPARTLSGELQWRIHNTRITKSIAAGQPTSVLLSTTRTQSLIHLLRYPTEPTLPKGPVDWIEVAYPAVEVSLFGMEAHWSAWFLLFSSIGALLFAKARAA